MADVLIIHSPDKATAAERLREALTAAGYSVEAKVIQRLDSSSSLRGADPPTVRLLIWSRPLVASTLGTDALGAIRREPNLIEVSADGILPPGSDESRVVLISGWRGQPFHPGWQTILAALKTMCEPVRPVSEAASRPPSNAGGPAYSIDPSPPAGGPRQPGGNRKVALAIACAGLIAAAVGGAAWIGRGNSGVGHDPAPAPAVVSAPAALPSSKSPTQTSAPPPDSLPAKAAGVPAQAGSNAASEATDGSVPGAKAQPPASTSGDTEAPRTKRSSTGKTPATSKRYSRKYSKNMRLFCERSGRTTPQCKMFLRSLAKRTGKAAPEE